MCTRKRLAEVAKAAAEMPFYGILQSKEANIQQIVELFPKWTIKQADKNWCAAFVYYCCIKAGFKSHIVQRSAYPAVWQVAEGGRTLLSMMSGLSIILAVIILLFLKQETLYYMIEFLLTLNMIILVLY